MPVKFNARPVVSCLDCPFYAAVPGPRPTNEEPAGECRENSPTIVEGEEAGDIETVFPPVPSSLWCGHHPLLRQWIRQRYGHDSIASDAGVGT